MITPDKINDIPQSPGCYIYRNKNKEVIYVGKAKQLRKRVSSYFSKLQEGKTKQLVDEIEDIDFIVTNNEVSALLLENSLIKKHYPKYNIDLKDAQKYAYIHLTKSELPWIEIERARDNQGEYYGPFVSGAIRKQIFDILTRNFKILYRKPSPQLKKSIDTAAYQKRLSQARKILKGDVDELITELKKEMGSASTKTYYEHALNLRNQISALKSLKEKQLVEFSKAIDSNIINYLVSDNKVYLLIFSIRSGVLEGKQEYIFDHTPDFLNEFILRHYDYSPIPKELILPQEFDPTLEEYLSEKKQRKVSIIIPKIGDNKQLLDLVLQNVHTTFFSGKVRLIELQKALNLPKLPYIMECFDISHLSGTNTTASMVSFINGVPEKSNYRKFKIRAPTEGDDFWAMREVVNRRYSGSLSKKMKKPDLIIIDGGLGQLYAAVQILRDINLNVPIISLAKREEEIYVPGNSVPIRLPKTNKGLQLLQAIRDEAHRFALTYQKLLRKNIFKNK